MPQLRSYQLEAKAGVYQAWQQGHKNVALVLPTGAGKTVTMATIINEFPGSVCAIAHRQELVIQISIALARAGVRHRIIGPDNIVKFIVQLHMQETGTSYYNPGAKVAVAGVDTLVRRADKLKHWADSVGLWVQDECHHVLQRNKWGAAAKMFPNARGLGVTATPCRADGYGLGSHADGVFNTMFVGPSLRWMISEGYLTDYRLFAPPSDMRFDTIEPGASGDYNHKQLRAVAKESHIVGDVVEHYLKLATGKLGITFAPDIETATEITAQFNAAGVPAQLVTGETPDQLRIEYMRRFKQRQLLQLVNVDLFGEGVDVPAVEVVSMARKTESFSLFVQQGGRGLRPVYAAGFDLSTKAGRLAAIAASDKRDAIIIDHVGNIARHAVARDCPYTGRLVADLCHREWSLDRRERRSKGAPTDAIPMTHCPMCTGSYPRVYSVCPYCQHKPEPRGRSSPEFVDGDLLELDEAALVKLRGDVAKVDMTPGEYRAQLMDQNVPTVGVMANVKRHVERQGAQAELRELIEQWAGWQKHFGRSRSESYRRFWFNFGIDVMSAQALGVDDARALSIKIIEKMGAE